MSKPRRFAQDTKVPVTQSRAEVEQLLGRYGADQFLFGSEPGLAVVGFRVKGIQVKMRLKLPKGDTPRDEKERRRLWRALALVIKAKLEACESGVAVFEDEFMPYTVMPDGQTLGDWARPQIADMYKSGKMPPLIPGASGKALPPPA